MLGTGFGYDAVHAIIEKDERHDLRFSRGARFENPSKLIQQPWNYGRVAVNPLSCSNWTLTGSGLSDWRGHIRFVAW